MKQFNTSTDTEISCKAKQEKSTLLTCEDKELEPYAPGTKRKFEVDNDLLKVIITDLKTFNIKQN